MKHTQVTHLYQILGVCQKMLRKKIQESPSIGQLTPNEMLLMAALLREPRLDTAKELSARLGMSPALVSRGVDSLIHKGLLAARQDPADRRVYRLSPCLAHREEVEERLNLVEQSCWESLTRGIAPQELRQFESVLKKMLDNIQEEQ